MTQVGTEVATPVVCIGMSAGGVEPLQQIFRALIPTTGMAFVVVHHVRRESPGLLVAVLSRCTTMPVSVASDKLPLLPNHVYILPSGGQIALMDGRFCVEQQEKPVGWPNVVSRFVESMSRSHHRGIAVILSGMDADGAAQLAALKRHGGLVIAQLPSSASVPDMPRAAIATGAVDYVLDPEAIGERISELSGTAEFTTKD